MAHNTWFLSSFPTHIFPFPSVARPYHILSPWNHPHLPLRSAPRCANPPEWRLGGVQAVHGSHLFGQRQHLPQQGIHLRQLLRVAFEEAELQLRGEGRQQRDVARRMPCWDHRGWGADDVRNWEKGRALEMRIDGDWNVEVKSWELDGWYVSLFQHVVYMWMGEFTDLLGESLGGIWDTVWETRSSGRSLLGSWYMGIQVDGCLLLKRDSWVLLGDVKTTWW